jgi:hypothetical protein
VRHTYIVLVLFVLGCGEDAPPPGATSAPVAPVAPVAPAAPEPPSTTAVPSSPPQTPPTATAAATREGAPALDAARARAYRRSLRAARIANREGRADEAVQQYEAALAISNDGRALCELGWIHFQAQRYDQARTSITRALALLPASTPVPAPFVGPVGACFYNLGRLEEQSGDVAAARRAYERSLAVRPGNAAVAARLAALAAPPSAPSEPAGAHQCGASGAAIVGDVDAWIARVRQLSGRPASFDGALAELDLGAIDPDLIVDEYGDADEDATLTVEVRSEPMRLSGGIAGRYVHVHLAAADNTFDRLAVLRAVEGGHCVVGTDESDIDMCSTACLGDDASYAPSLVQLVAADVDALRIDTASGACACGSERGASVGTRFLGVEGDALATYAEITRYSGWYQSPWPPVQETSGEITLGDTFPRTITVVTEITCEEGCTSAEIEATRSEIEALEDEDERAEAEAELEDSCGYVESCEESRETDVYRYRDHTYAR